MRNVWTLVSVGALVALSGCALIYDYEGYAGTGGAGGGASGSGGNGGGAPGAGGGGGGAPPDGGTDAGETCDFSMGMEQGDCYTGPPGTKGVGVCKPGVRFCMGDTNTWGPCMAERVPSPEIGKNQEDEDCDGGNAGLPVWARVFGDAVNEQNVRKLAVRADGSVLVAGDFAGALGMLDMNGAPIHAGMVAGDSGGFVASLDASGSPVWTRAFFTGATKGRIAGVAPGVMGEVYVTGDYLEAGNRTGFVMRIGADGMDLWSLVPPVVFGSTGQVTPQGVGVDVAGNVYVVGMFQGSMTIGGTTLDALGSDMFVIKYEPGGTVLWAKALGSAGQDDVTDVAVCPLGGVVFTGSYAGMGLSTAGDAGTRPDVFVASVDANGTVSWVKGFPETPDLGNSRGLALALDAGCNVVVGGRFTGQLVVPGLGPWTSDAEDGFVLALSSKGVVSWARTFSGEGAQEVAGVAVRGDLVVGSETVAVVGSFQNAIDLALGAPAELYSPEPSGGEIFGRDLFLAKLGTQGAYTWASKFTQNSEPAGERSLRVAFDGQGAVVMAGGWTKNLEFGVVPLPPFNGNLDAFVAKYSP